MNTADYSPRALEDLKAIFDFIAADRRDAAEKTVERVLDACDTLAKFPELGLSRDELAPGVRAFVVGSYVAYYSPTPRGIRVERVLHAARDSDAFHK